MDTMTPSQILAWLTEHGGQAGPETKDARGRTVWTARDGAALVVSRTAAAGPDPRKQPEQWRVEETRAAGSAPVPQQQPATRGGGAVADRDPNAIVSQTWLEKPDELEGLQIPEGFVIGTGAGQYYASKITYADGRTEIQWYKRGSGTGGKDDPIALTTAGPVAKSVKDKWDKEETQQANNPRQTPQPIPSSGQQLSKGADGHIYQYNPQTGLYDIPRPDLDNTTSAGTSTTAPRVPAGSYPRIEGTPTGQTDAQGQPIYDNTQPIRAWHAPDGKIYYEALTPQEKQDWERGKNPGGKTDAEIRTEQQTASDTKPLEGYPGWSVRTTKQGNETRTVFLNPSGQEAPDPRPAANVPKPLQTADGSWGYWDTTKSPPTWVPIQGGPQPEQKPVQVNGVWGIWKPGQNGAAPTFQEVPAPAGVKTPYPADLPAFHFDWLHPDGDGGIAEWARQVRARPDLTDKQKADIISEAHASATALLARARDTLTTQENTRSAGVTQRGQDISMANTRLNTSSANFGNALTAAMNATKYSVGPDAANVLPYFLGMAELTGQRYGGFVTPPREGDGPAIQQVGQMGLPGRGLPQVPGLLQPAPSQPIEPPPPTAPPNEAAQNAASLAQPVQPIFRPQPPVDLQPSSGPLERDDWRQGMGQPPGQVAAMFPMPGGQPQQAPYAPTGAGAMLMQRAGGYDPTGLNRILLQAGLDPEVIQMMGGVG